MDKPRLAVVVRTLAGGGAEKAAAKLAGGLSNMDFKVDVLFLKSIQVDYSIPGEVNALALSSSGSILSSLVSLTKHLLRTPYDAILSFGCTANLAAVLARACGYPLGTSSPRLVLSVQNHMSSQMQNVEGWAHRSQFRIARYAYLLADHVVTVSDGVRNNLLELSPLPAQKVSTVYNPVVTPEISRLAQEDLDFPWIDSTDGPLVLAVGRLAKQKDFSTLLEAFNILKGDLDARLLILGKGPLRSQLEQQASALGISDRIRMPGHVDNPYKFMASADVLALSSRWEGLPTVLIEAMACGCQCVATDCPSGPAEILEKGKWGALVPTEDPAALAKEIRKQVGSSTDVQERASAFSLERSLQGYFRILTPKDNV